MKQQMKTFLRSASAMDAGKIATLVNSAYRPLAHERGWTHEANLVSGQRTTEEQILSLDCSRSSILVLCQDANIVACVHVKCGENSADIGMLATDPNHQMQGLGKQMLNCAEQRAGPIRLDRISTAISGALRGSVIHGGDSRRSVWTVGWRHGG